MGGGSWDYIDTSWADRSNRASSQSWRAWVGVIGVGYSDMYWGVAIALSVTHPSAGKGGRAARPIAVCVGVCLCTSTTVNCRTCIWHGSDPWIEASFHPPLHSPTHQQQGGWLSLPLFSACACTPPANRTKPQIAQTHLVQPLHMPRRRRLHHIVEGGRAHCCHCHLLACLLACHRRVCSLLGGCGWICVCLVDGGMGM